MCVCECVVHACAVRACTRACVRARVRVFAVVVAVRVRVCVCVVKVSQAAEDDAASCSQSAAEAYGLCGLIAQFTV